MFDLTGKTALVTGAATGLGAAAGVLLAKAGADVAITDRRGLALDETRRAAEVFKRRVLSGETDVIDLSQINDCVASVEREFGKIDILVNNAGINLPTPGIEVTAANWDEHFNTNVKGGFFAAQPVAKGMIERGWGRIIFISSQSGLVGIPGQPVYCATKGAVNQLVRTLGVEWAKFGVTVNAVALTFVETILTRKRLQDPRFREFVLAKIPCGKLALPEHVASFVVFFGQRRSCHSQLRHTSRRWRLDSVVIGRETHLLSKKTYESE